MALNRYFIMILSVVLLLSAGTQGEAASLPSMEHRTVLFISPYHTDMPHHRLAKEAVMRVFRRAKDLKIDVYTEYLDIHRFSNESDQELLWSFYKRRYADMKIDLVMLADVVPLDAWQKYGAEMAPEAPVVFFDLFNSQVKVRQLPSNTTGVSGVEDYVPTLEWWLRIRPKTSEVVLIRNAGSLGHLYEAPIETLRRGLGDRVSFTDLSDLPLEEIKRRVRGLPSTSVIVYQYILRDAEGQPRIPAEVLAELAVESSVPIISGYDQFVGTGSIGGYVYYIEKQASQAAEMALRILHGEPADAISMVEKSSGFAFDHGALQRFKIPVSSLPSGSILKNRQHSMWTQHRSEIVFICIVIVGLTLIVGYLAILNRRLRYTRCSLRDLNESLDVKVRDRTAALSEANDQLKDEMVERVRVESEQDRLIEELQDALSRVKQLEGILPICSFCKKIRDEGGKWQAMETYITHRSEALFSHSFCPECGRVHYPEFVDETDG